VSRTKTRKRPAPRRAPRPSRKEVKTLIPGHARGADAFLMMRRKAGRWAVLDHFRGAPAYVGAGDMWMELKPETPDAEVYRWTEGHARALVARFVEQAVDIARNNRALDAAFEAAETARRIERLAAGMAPAAVMPEQLTLEQVAARLQQATAEVAARMKRAKPVEADTTTVPAPMDHPEYQPRRPDTASLQQPLTLLGASIPANWEDPTVALPVLRVHGPADTAQSPVLPEWPPLPDKPPTIHLTHLAEAHPDAGERIRRSVADALASH
jgi:hypothetical protein